MAKGDRKRANVDKDKSPRKKAVTKPDRSKAMPIQQNEAFMFKDLIDQSNLYGKLLKQFEQYEFAMQDLIWKRKQVQQGKIKLPIYLPFAGNSLYEVNDKKKVLKDLDKQIEVMQNSINGIKGQMLHRRDEFIESGLRLKDFISARFGIYTTKNIHVPNAATGVRVKTGKHESEDAEKKLFEAEFDDIMKSAEKQNEFKKAVEQAKEENKKLEK